MNIFIFLAFQKQRKIFFWFFNIIVWKIKADISNFDYFGVS